MTSRLINSTLAASRRLTPSDAVAVPGICAIPRLDISPPIARALLSLFLPRERQGKIERRPLVDPALRPHPSAVACDNALDDGKADPGTFEFIHAMQALEHAEQLADKLHIEADTI